MCFVSHHLLVDGLLFRWNGVQTKMFFGIIFFLLQNDITRKQVLKFYTFVVVRVSKNLDETVRLQSEKI